MPGRIVARTDNTGHDCKQLSMSMPTAYLSDCLVCCFMVLSKMPLE